MQDVLTFFKQLYGRLTIFHLARFTLFLFFLTLFFPVGVRFFDPALYLSGGNNPYTSFWIYLSDVFLFLSLFFWCLALYLDPLRFKKLTFGDKRLMFFILLFLLFLEASVFVAMDTSVSFFALIRFIEYFAAYIMVANHVIEVRQIMYTLFFVFLFESFVAIFQSMKQGSLGLSFLGETFLSPTLPGVAKVALDDQNFLRSYGTFLHPNILGGWIAFLILPMLSVRYREKVFYTALLFVFLLGLVLTFSRTAWLALLFGLIMYHVFTRKRFSPKAVIVFLSLFLLFIVAFNVGGVLFKRISFQDRSAFDQRKEFLAVSFDMAKKHPLGVGLNNFTLALPDIVARPLAPWEHQPVHNVFALFINELGVPGGLFYMFFWFSLFFWLLKKVRVTPSQYEKNYGYLLMGSHLVVTLLQFFDHYVVSQAAGLALLFLFLMLVNEFLVHPLTRRGESL